MPDPNGLDIHDIKIAHVPSFDKNGQTIHNTVVEYSVGPHGPFYLTYPSGTVTPDRMNADIDRSVADLRAVVVRP